MLWIAQHQTPWFYPAIWEPTCSQDEVIFFDTMHSIAKGKAAELGFAECIVILGGDHGFHHEHRLYLDSNLQWWFQRDSPRLTPVSGKVIAIEEKQVQPFREALHRTMEGITQPPMGLIQGNEMTDEGYKCFGFLCCWYKADMDRLVLLHGFRVIEDYLHGRL